MSTALQDRIDQLNIEHRVEVVDGMLVLRLSWDKEEYKRIVESYVGDIRGPRKTD